MVMLAECNDAFGVIGAASGYLEVVMPLDAAIAVSDARKSTAMIFGVCVELGADVFGDRASEVSALHTTRTRKRSHFWFSQYPPTS
jgi:hypothetical protein